MRRRLPGNAQHATMNAVGEDPLGVEGIPLMHGETPEEEGFPPMHGETPEGDSGEDNAEGSTMTVQDARSRDAVLW